MANELKGAEVMKELLHDIDSWRQSGERVALATVVLLVVVVVITEMDLARNFDREGRRRG